MKQSTKLIIELQELLRVKPDCKKALDVAYQKINRGNLNKYKQMTLEYFGLAGEDSGDEEEEEDNSVDYDELDNYNSYQF